MTDARTRAGSEAAGYARTGSAFGRFLESKQAETEDNTLPEGL